MFDELVRMSQLYGSDPELIQAGGGNTSVKESGSLWVKGSGIMLRDVKGRNDFVRLQLDKVLQMVENNALQGLSGQELDLKVNESLMSARLDETPHRPSIETVLHAVVPDRLVAHTHPVYVNAMACAMEGEEIAAGLFAEDEYVYLGFNRPGFLLGLALKDIFRKHEAAYGKRPRIVFMKNHGLITSGSGFEDVDRITKRVCGELKSLYGEFPAAAGKDACNEEVPDVLIKYLESAYARHLDNMRIQLEKSTNGYIRMMLDEGFAPGVTAWKALYPDHVVYCGEAPLVVDKEADEDEISAELGSFIRRYGYYPRYIIIKGLAVFVAGSGSREIKVREEMLDTHAKTLTLLLRKGEPEFLSQEDCRFLAGWEAEKYRQKI